MKKVTVGLVLWKDKYLAKSIPSLLNQDYENIEFIFRDAEEGVHSAYHYLKNELPEIFSKVKISCEKNLWHSGGHNAIIREMTGDYYLCVSNDMLYPHDMISRMVQAFESHAEVGFVGCKLKRWDYVNNQKTPFIDTLGIAITPANRYYEIAQGKKDKGQSPKAVFGVSAALAMYKKEALEAIKYHDEYFDELIHYKNDVDLSYRLQWAGFNPLIINDLEVYHDRQVSEIKKKPLWVIRSSYRGDLIVLMKNFSKYFPWWCKLKTVLYLGIKSLFLLTIHPILWKEIAFVRKNHGLIKRKAGLIKKSPEQASKIVTLMKQCNLLNLPRLKD
jgi:GT2 family glycosyltransferase